MEPIAPRSDPPQLRAKVNDRTAPAAAVAIPATLVKLKALLRPMLLAVRVERARNPAMPRLTARQRRHIRRRGGRLQPLAASPQRTGRLGASRVLPPVRAVPDPHLRLMAIPIIQAGD